MKSIHNYSTRYGYNDNTVSRAKLCTEYSAVAVVVA